MCGGESVPPGRDGAPWVLEATVGPLPAYVSSESGAFVRRLPSPTDLLLGLAAGASEVSRFSCMKFLGVCGVYDYAGPSGGSRYRPCSCCLPRMLKTSASGMTFR